MKRERKNLAGLTFGVMKVLEPAGNYPQGGPLWKCRCACGNERIVSAQTLQRSPFSKCSCANKKLERLPPFTYSGITAKLTDLCRSFGVKYETALYRLIRGSTIDEAMEQPFEAKNWKGKTKGVLTVVGPVHGKTGIWRCMCECGREKTLRGVTLERQSYATCVCLRLRSNNLPDRPLDKKYCTKCGKLKEQSDFAFLKHCQSSACKTCIYEQHKAWLDSNPDLTTVYARKHFERNRPQILARNRAYSKLQRETLGATYIRALLRSGRLETESELIELKRNQLRLKRIVKRAFEVVNKSKETI